MNIYKSGLHFYLNYTEIVWKTCNTLKALKLSMQCMLLLIKKLKFLLILMGCLGIDQTTPKDSKSY